MRTLVGLTLIASSLFAVAAHAYHLEDSLRGATSSGNPSGGSFGAEGWTVTAPTDLIWFSAPTMSSGSIEFTLSNVTNASLYADASGGADNDIFQFYDDAGIGEPIPYGTWKSNNYKCDVRIRNEPGHHGDQKLIFGLCPDSQSSGGDTCACGTPFIGDATGGDGNWDGTPQRLRVEWSQTYVRFLRNGAEAVRHDFAATGYGFGPQQMHFSLGTTRSRAVSYSGIPIGAVFSDLVVDGVDGAPASCPGTMAPVDMSAPPPMSSGNMIPVLEDVTVSPQFATSVYPDANDLACGASDGSVYLKFDLREINGRATRATLYLHSAGDASAAGDGGDLEWVPDTTWSESTLTWNARPSPSGGSLGRITGVAPDTWYSVDVSARVSDASLYAFALVPSASDQNGAHFLSKEASATLRAYLQIEVSAIAPQDATAPVVIDAGSVTSPPDAGTAPTSSADAAVAHHADAAPSAQGQLTSGCACAITGHARAPSGALALTALALLLLRRRRARA